MTESFAALVPLPKPPVPRNQVTQVVGLVPIFPCTATECRLGKYLADNISDDTQFPLPVFADLVDTTAYKNDFNSWLVELPTAATTVTFVLQKYDTVTTIWNTVATLNNNTYGTFYNTYSLCPGLLWKGFKLDWRKVLQFQGEGKYKFVVQLTAMGKENCGASPPFCLEAWDCYKVDRTTKWEFTFSGGFFGSIDLPGKGWTFCCCKSTPQSTGNVTTCTPITWRDSIRMEGFFGREKSDHEKTSLKYTTGVIKKVRDELIQKFDWRSGNLPKWLHDRFKSYGLMSDLSYVSDYNINNSDYNIKSMWVVSDSGYEPTYFGYSRYTKVEVQFKEGQQTVYRNRCC